jgi:hypothetical protein
MAVIKGTSVYKVPVFRAVVVFNASNMQIKKMEKNRLIIRLLGKALLIAFLFFFFNKTKGNNTKAAIANLNSVSENGLITPDSFADDRNEPATKRVTSNDRKWYFKFFISNLLYILVIEWPTEELDIFLKGKGICI